MKRKNIFRLILLPMILFIVIVGSVFINRISFATENFKKEDIKFTISPSKIVFKEGEQVNIDMSFISNKNDVLLYKNVPDGMQISISYFLHFLIISNDGSILQYYNSGFMIPEIPYKADFIKLNKGDQYKELLDLRKFYRECSKSKCSTYMSNPKILNWKKGTYKIRAIYMNNFDKINLWRGSTVSNEINITIK